MVCELQSEVWQLLFHSSKHGQSFNTFMGHVGEPLPCSQVLHGVCRDQQPQHASSCVRYNNLLCTTFAIAESYISCRFEATRTDSGMLEQTQALCAQVADILCELIVCGRFAAMSSCQAICQHPVVCLLCSDTAIAFVWQVAKGQPFLWYETRRATCLVGMLQSPGPRMASSLVR